MQYTDLGKVDLLMMTSDEAAKLPPVSATDKGVTVHCGGYEERWNSRAVAKAFYRLGFEGCDGSEADRYCTIWADLDSGVEVPSDGMPLRKRKAA